MIPLVEVVQVAGGWTVRMTFGREFAHAIHPDTQDAAWGSADYLAAHPTIAWAVFEAHTSARKVAS